MAVQTKAWGKAWIAIWGKLQRYSALVRGNFAAIWQQTESVDYQAWRHRFLGNRLRLCLWIALPCFVTIVSQSVYELFLQAAKFDQEMMQIFGNPDLPDRVRQLSVITNTAIGILLAACFLLQRSRWGQRYPAVMFLCFSWSVTLVPQIIATQFGLPDSGDGVWFLMFLVQATLMPVHWRLHLVSQLGAFIYYAGVNPLLGLTAIEGKSIYSAGMFILLFWFCFICDLAVYLYEKLQRAEFESRRELRVFLHSVSHDLKTPVMGTSIVLQNLLKKAGDDQVVVSKQVLERLLQGSNRQLSLINALLEAHEAEVQELMLHCQPTVLRQFVDAVVADLEPALLKNQITLHQTIAPDLPPVNIDPTQMWRVYSNLISNAIKHNPHGIEVTLGAEVIDHPLPWGTEQLGAWAERRQSHSRGLVKLAKATVNSTPKRWLCCYVQDTGIGIPPAQRERLFELYARGSRARYMPGLGLGLYLCRQIINAHQGEIGIGSTATGTTFWFTLPLLPVT